MSNAAEPKGRLGKVIFFLKFLEIRMRFVVVLVVTALVVGYWDTLQNYYERWTRGAPPAETESTIEYTCSMHPFVKSSHPGKCPICGMDLIVRVKSTAKEGAKDQVKRVQVSPERIHQTGIQIEPVEYRLLVRELRAYGSVETDETRMKRIVARFPGRIEELLVNAVALEVKEGEPLARIYSPKFLAASREYVQALAAQHRAEADPQATAEVRRSAQSIADSARHGLALAGFTPAQLDALAQTGQASDRVTLYSPVAGTVLEKNVLLGETVEEGTVLYTIADLSALWVQAEIVEADLGLVTPGLPVEITSVAYPDKIFPGLVDLVYPTLNTETRAVKARIVVSNRDARLKPGMFVTAAVRAPLGRYGEIGTPSEPKVEATPVAAAAAAAKDIYTCPMHPEIVRDKPGSCPICGMNLVKKPPEPAAGGPDTHWAEGWACPMHLDHLDSKPGTCRVCDCGMTMKKWRVERVTSVPETAVIDTGSRTCVYVEQMTGVFDQRQVKLGPRAGAYFPVTDGLKVGEKVATRGSFLIDAEARLNPQSTPGEPGTEPAPNAAPAEAGGTREGAAQHQH